MRKFFLLALPLASLVMFTGCEETNSNSYGGTGFTSPTSGQTAAAPAAAAAPAPAPTYPRRASTTQSLPSGWGYMHEADLTGGRLGGGGATTTTSTTTAPVAQNGG